MGTAGDAAAGFKWFCYGKDHKSMRRSHFYCSGDALIVALGKVLNKRIYEVI